MEFRFPSLVFCAGVIWVSPSVPPRAEDDEGAKEFKRLEGVWASVPAKKGRDRGYILAFHGGRMLWRSFQTEDGEFVIGHSIIYDLKLDPKESPKQLTATFGEDKAKETRVGIYELEGDVLKVAFGVDRDGKLPKKLGEGEIPVITLSRKKNLKVPDLTKAGKERKETYIEPTRKWTAQVVDLTVLKLCPKNPITTQPRTRRGR